MLTPIYRYIPLISLLSLPVHSDVPNTFTSGSPARAAEVNENFKSMDDRISELEASSVDIESIEGRISTLEETSINCGDTPHNISYTAKAATVGSLVTIGGQDFRIIRIPFVAFETGNHYAVTLPSEVNKNESTIEFLSTRHTANRNGGCRLHFSIGDYPAYMFQPSEYRNFNTYINSTSESHMIRRTSASISFNIEKTEVFLHFDISETEQTLNVPDGDYDLVDNFDLDLASHSDDIFNNLDELIDYISIEEL